MKLRTDSPRKTLVILGVFVMSLFFIAAVNSACKKEGAEEQAGTEEAGRAAMIEEGLNTVEGTVKLVHGPFLYIPEAVGFDVVLPAGTDASALEGKKVRLSGEFHRDKPSILSAARIEVLEEGGAAQVFFEKAAEAAEPSFFNQRERESYPVLKLTTTAAADAWEGKGKGRVFGKLEQQGATNVISVSDDKGKPLGKILVDGVSDFAVYSMKKLRLFDSFWFYLEIKESVEAKTRAKSKELFHADVAFTGLY